MSYLSNIYRGLISCTNSDMVESLPLDSENPAGMSEAAAPFVTPLGHSLVIMNQGNQQTDCVLENKQVALSPNTVCMTKNNQELINIDTRICQEQINNSRLLSYRTQSINIIFTKSSKLLNIRRFPTR